MFLYVLLLALLMPEIEVEKIPALIKRCPQCHSLTLDFDVKTGTIKCSKCGFEQKLKMVKT